MPFPELLLIKRYKNVIFYYATPLKFELYVKNMKESRIFTEMFYVRK